MESEIARAYVQIVPTTRGISGSISSVLEPEANKAGSSAGAKLSSALGATAKVGIASAVALGTAVTGASAAIVGSASATAQYGDSIDKMSQKLGISSTFYQEWDAVLQHSGTSMDAMGGTFKKLATNIQNGGKSQEEAFNKLGLSMEQLQGMSTEDAFTNIVTALQGMEEGTERTALATQLLGRGAQELGPLLNTSAEDTQSMIDTVNELGGVMSGDAVKASAAFQDSLQDMQTAFAGVKNTAMAELLPGMTEVMNAISGIMTGTEGAGEQLSTGLTNIVTAITTAMPQIGTVISSVGNALITSLPSIISQLVPTIINGLNSAFPTIVSSALELLTSLTSNLPQLVSVALQMISTLANGLIEALPTLIPAIVDISLEIVDTLIDNLDMLVDAAIQLIMALSDGIINALPKLIEKMPEIIVKLAEALIRNAPKLIMVGPKLMIALAGALIDNIPKLIAKVPQIITGIVNAFKDNLSKVADIGKHIIEGIWNGINDKITWLKEKITGACDAILGKFKEMFDINSPSKVFAKEVGKWIPEGIAVGINANTDSIDKAMSSVNDVTLGAFNAGNYKASSYSAQKAESFDYTELASVITETMANMNMTVSIGQREFGRVVRSVT